MASVHAFTLHAVPPVAHPQELPAPSDVALHAANVVNKNDVQAVAATQAVPLNEQVER